MYDAQDDQRQVVVDDANHKHVAGIVNRVAERSSWNKNARQAHVCPHEYRDGERHVVNPYVDDNSCSHADLECTSTDLLQSQKSTRRKLISGD